MRGVLLMRYHPFVKIPSLDLRRAPQKTFRLLNVSGKVVAFLQEVVLLPNETSTIYLPRSLSS